MNVEELKNEISVKIKNSTNVLNSIKKLEKLEQIDPLKNLILIKQGLSNLEKIIENNKTDLRLKESLKEYLQIEKNKITEWEVKAKKAFGQELENLLKANGFEMSGIYPLLKVTFYTLEVNLENFNVIIWYGPQQEKIDSCKLNPEEVVKKIKESHSRITQQRLNDDNFLAKLLEAYNLTLHKTGLKMNTPISVSKILFEYVVAIQDEKFKINPMKNNYKEYGRVFFSYDLFRLKKRLIDGKTLSLVTATRAYTKNRADFLWIPTNEKGNGDYISHIKFMEATK